MSSSKIENLEAKFNLDAADRIAKDIVAIFSDIEQESNTLKVSEAGTKEFERTAVLLSHNFQKLAHLSTTLKCFPEFMGVKITPKRHTSRSRSPKTRTNTPKSRSRTPPHQPKKLLLYDDDNDEDALTEINKKLKGATRWQKKNNK